MKTALTRLGLGLAATALAIPLAVGPVAAATPPTAAAPTVESTTATAASPEYEAVAGNFANFARAEAYRDRLANHGFRGFVVERETRGGKNWFQVERTFEHRDVAVAQVNRLHWARYNAWLEIDAG